MWQINGLYIYIYIYIYIYTKTNEKRKSSFNFYFAFALCVSPLLQLFRHSKVCLLTCYVTDLIVITIIMIIKNGFIFRNKKPLFVISHDLRGAENLVKQKDSELRGQSCSTFINMLADSQHTCVWVSNLLFMNFHSISQDITRFSYIIMSTSCSCYYKNQVH